MSAPSPTPSGAQSVGNPPQYTMYLDQSAHLDWDWIRTFPQNYWYYKYGQGVQEILTTAIGNLQSSNLYTYEICEMGFFKKFIEENPSQIAAIQQAGDRFQVISGGVTSPD